MYLWLLALFFVGTPIVLTVFNIVFLFAEKKINPHTVKIVDACIFGLGIPFTVVFAWYISFHDWYEQLYLPAEKYTGMGGTYTPIASESLPTFLALCLVAIAGYGLLRVWGKRKNPL